MLAWILLLIAIFTALAIFLGRKEADLSNSNGKKSEDRDHEHSRSRDKNIERNRNRSNNNNNDQQIDENNEDDEEIIDEEDDLEEKNKKNKKTEKPKEKFVEVELPKEGDLSDETREGLKRADAHLKKIDESYREKTSKSVIEGKMKDISTIDKSKLNKKEKEEHDSIINSVMTTSWKQTRDAFEEYIGGVYRLQYSIDNLDEMIEKTPAFPDFVEQNKDIIALTSEKYNYYNFFVQRKADELIKKADKDVEKIDEIKKIVSRIEYGVKDSKVGMDDFLIYAEEQLQKLEKIEKSMATKKEVKPKNVQKDLVLYNNKLASNKNDEGKTIDDLIGDKVDKLNKEGVLTLGERNKADRQLLIEALKKIWIEKVKKAQKQTNQLIEQVKTVKDGKQILENKPTLDIDKWINSEEFRVIAPQVIFKFNLYDKCKDIIENESQKLEYMPEEFKDQMNEYLKELQMGVVSYQVDTESFNKACAAFMGNARKAMQEIAKQKVIYTDFVEKGEEKIYEDNQLIAPKNKN